MYTYSGFVELAEVRENEAKECLINLINYLLRNPTYMSAITTEYT